MEGYTVCYDTAAVVYIFLPFRIERKMLFLDLLVVEGCKIQDWVGVFHGPLSNKPI